MDAGARTRYPGAQPFADDGLSRRLFRGREHESTALTHQILANRLVVLFARSGLGKTSLLNAGVAENLRAQGFLPLSVRVNDSSLGPLESIYRGVAAASARQDVEFIAGDKASLWHFFKTSEFWQKDVLLTPVLILDQFEELFTLQAEQQRSAFIDQLSYLVRGVRPTESPTDAMDATASRTQISDAPPSVKILVSLREDFLAELEELSDRIPEILDQRFRLLALARPAASRALEEPASIEDPHLTTKPFELDARGRDAVLDFLEHRAGSSIRRSSGNVEPFQLQLICQRLEEIAARKQHEGVRGSVKVTLEEIGGTSRLRGILKDFYKKQVAAVSSWRQRRGVRRLCSEFLISPQGRRLRMEESEITRLVRVNSDTLRTLVDRRLLRADQSAEGTYYELSHDSLIGPVLDSRRLLFLLRAVVLLILVVVGVVVSLTLGLGMIGGVIQGAEEPLEAVILVAFFAMLLWVSVQWAIRNVRGVKDMWRRSRI